MKHPPFQPGTYIASGHQTLAEQIKSNRKIG